MLVANTRSARRYLIERLRARPDRIATIPLMVPAPRSDLLLGDASLPPKRGRVRFLYVGRLVPGKNVSAILRAAASLLSRGISFDVVVLGEGPEQSALEELRLSLGLSEVVHLAGSVPHETIGRVYEQSDVLVQPTLGDYRSVAVLEAMRFGMPVIDSLFDGHAGDTVADGVTGFVVDPRSTADLANAMERFSVEPNLIALMGSRAEAAVAELRISNTARCLLEVLGPISES